MHSTIPHVGNYQNYSFNNQQALFSHKNKFTKLGRWKSTWKLIGIYVSLDFFPSPNISSLYIFLFYEHSPFWAKHLNKYFFLRQTKYLHSLKYRFFILFFFCLPDKINNLIYQTLSPFSMSNSAKIYNMAWLCVLN